MGRRERPARRNYESDPKADRAAIGHNAVRRLGVRASIVGGSSGHWLRTGVGCGGPANSAEHRDRCDDAEQGSAKPSHVIILARHCHDIHKQDPLDF